MEPSDRLAHAEQIAKAVERSDHATIRQGLERQQWDEGGARDLWITQEAARQLEPDRPVEALSAETYALPAHAAKILPRALREELEGLLREVRGINESMVGVPTRVAHILLADDELVEEVRLGLRRWAERYATGRLAKPSPRDDGDPVAKFQRLAKELLPWLDELGHLRSTIHGGLLAEVADYLPWLFMQGTWGAWLDFDPLNGPFQKRWRVRAPTPGETTYCQDIATLYAWPSAYDVELLVRAIQAGRRPAPVDPVAARRRLAELAGEIREIRPFVIAVHNPEKSAVEVSPGVWASWQWGGSQQLGLMPIHDDERRRLTEHQSRTFSTQVRVRYDGLLASEFAPWVDVESIDLPPRRALAANLIVLEAQHARLMDLFAKVDLAAVYDRVRESARGDSGGAAPSQEDVAATFTAFEREPGAAPVIHTSVEPVAPGPRPRVPTLRLERFLAILERLGCEVRQGKGSEVVAYRPGGRIARIGRHTRNREVPSALAQRILHQVGVTLSEWVAALP